MEHKGHRQRMRERYAKNGLEGFAPHEVLELLLYYAIPQKDVNPIAHELLNRFETLRGVLRAEKWQLQQVKGVGENTAIFLTMLSKAWQYAQRQDGKEPVRLTTRALAEEYCINLLNGEVREAFYLICLTAQMRVEHCVLIARGSLREVPAYPRMVAEAVLANNAHSVLLCHNHPGGSLVPSPEDIEATRELSTLLRGLEVALIDHVIVAEGRTFSMVGNQCIR